MPSRRPNPPPPRRRPQAPPGGVVVRGLYYPGGALLPAEARAGSPPAPSAAPGYAGDDLVVKLAARILLRGGAVKYRRQAEPG